MTILSGKLLSSVSSSSPAAAPRRVRTDGQRFVVAATNESIVLSGPNVVVKGPPYLPLVSGGDICNDILNSECQAQGNCTSCTTFNDADVRHFGLMGWNSCVAPPPLTEARADPRSS